LYYCYHQQLCNARKIKIVADELKNSSNRQEQFKVSFPRKKSSSRQESVEKDESTKPMELIEPTLIERPEEDNDEAPRRSKRQRTDLVDDTPKTIAEAYSSPEADYWKEAVRREMDSIMSNGTWEVS
jgi:hypothetical protein